MKPKTALIRADASSFIGTGHIFRCINLANELEKNKIKCTFATLDLEGNVNDIIKKNGFDHIDLGKSEDFHIDKHYNHEKELNLLKNKFFDLLFIDHYFLKDNIFLSDKCFYKKIIRLSDFPQDTFCDYVVDYNADARIDDYLNFKAKKSCKFLLGYDYAIVKHVKFTQKKEKNLQKKILVSLGGSDPQNFTEKLISEIDKVKKDNILFQFFLGKNRTISNATRNIIEKNNRISKIDFTNNFSKYLYESDLCIVSLGTTIWECALYGKPTIGIKIAENQIRNLNNFSKANAIVPICNNRELSQIKNNIEEIISNEKLMSDLSKNISKLCDGKGASRIVEKLINV